MTSIPFPTTVDDVVTLIRRLYQPGHPEELSRIQETLQAVQRSADGWKLADALLEVPDHQVQFFGALTFTVKLNSDRDSVSEDDAPILRNRLINWLIKLASQQSPAFVTKKLCSTLVVFFLRFPDAWPDCLRHIICCFSVRHAGTEINLSELPDSTQLLGQLEPQLKLALLWFAAILVEEVGKIDTNSATSYHYHVKVQASADEAVLLMLSALEAGNLRVTGHPNIHDQLETRLVDAGLKTFQAWVNYSLRASIGSNLDFTTLKSLTPITLNLLAREEVFDTACDVLVDILTNYFTFFSPEVIQSLASALTSPWAIERYELLVTGEFDCSSIQFGKLLMAFAEATVQKLAKGLNTESGRTIMHMLHGILTIEGFPEVDEEVTSTTFEFWGSLIDCIVDAPNLSDSAPEDEWVSASKKEIAQAIQEYWRKIRMPSGQDLVRWTRDQREGFMSFRKDVADLVEEAYGILGEELFARFVEQVITALSHFQSGVDHQVAWDEVEASIFCINALSDALGDEPHEDVYLESLFASNLFTLLAEPRSDIPVKARVTSVNLIGSYSSFFERRNNMLPSALNFLFTCISIPSLSQNASKSICALCSSCRGTLTGELSAFIYQYENFASAPIVDDTAKERVLCAISYVIQALPTEEQKLVPLTKLLEFVEKDARQCMAYLSEQKEEYAKEMGLIVLRCLTSIGKGLQAPDDVPIVLGEEGPQESSFWMSSSGTFLQTKVVEIIAKIVDALHNDGEILDAACAVLRTGFTETLPGLFVFQPSLVTVFLLDHAQKSTRIETILSTASVFISSYSADGSMNITREASMLLDLVYGLVEHLGQPQSDPAIAQTAVEFITRLRRRYVHVLTGLEPKQRMERLFLFLLDALNVREHLVKKAAATFWSNFISLRDLDENIQTSVDEIVRGCGPALAEALISNIGGGCARSEIENIADPLRKLVARQVRAKGWLGAALEKEGFPSPTLSEKDKKLFLEKVMSLRGKAATNQVAKEFWLKARGTEFAYAS